MPDPAVPPVAPPAEPPAEPPAVVVAREDVALAILHAPRRCRAALTALFALDERLGSVVRTTREPLVGQMRLTWWHEALAALDSDVAPAEPVLRGLAATVIGRGSGGGAVAGRELAGLIDGWELLLEDTALDDATLRRFAAERGGRLFALAARLIGAEEPADVGEGWALADLAVHWSHAETAARAGALARGHLDAVRRMARPLGMLARFAAADLRALSAPREGGRLRRMLRGLAGSMTGLQEPPPAR